jgi:diguanylate cyclase (GGDEF)-like protein
MIFYHWFQQQSIKNKLIVSNVIVILVALFPVVVSMLVYEYQALLKNTLQDSRTQAAIVSDSVASAMAFTDAKTAAEALASFEVSNEVLAAALVLPNNKVLATYYKRNALLNDAALNFSTETTTFNDFIIRQPVYLQSVPVGTLIIKSSLNAFHSRLMLYLLTILVCTVIGLWLSFWLATSLTRVIVAPLTHLIAATERITQVQDYSQPQVVVESEDEIGKLSRSFGKMMSHIHERDLSLQQLAYYDSVTGLPNRHCFQERIEQAVQNALRYGSSSCCLMFIDLDDFKIVNDTLGHKVGDWLLKEVGQRITKTLRNTDIVCRIGGDEFAIILENVKDINTTDLMATKLITALSTPFIFENETICIGASVGVSACPDFSSDTVSLLSSADKAMYFAKEQGKNRFQRYSPTL